MQIWVQSQESHLVPQSTLGVIHKSQNQDYSQVCPPKKISVIFSPLSSSDFIARYSAFFLYLIPLDKILFSHWSKHLSISLLSLSLFSNSQYTTAQFEQKRLPFLPVTKTSLENISQFVYFHSALTAFTSNNIGIYKGVGTNCGPICFFFRQ